ncbi:hypothetical protein A2154_04375 [Candidatus Gottesmanbacteria bacterium RBG_16_43_7]|uniref:Uncharacterized protein n=1 Tax=Candidatus Gottesmanbacteria bacterium RBG_16_43_7 TaxID=1798373 RepID=A0A1F5ZC58_9BACT|nr:MAG: hypothetical protein A2154_04375 [Candidatus Gottesmanbacteria bacterium RBG_16_43_7]
MAEQEHILRKDIGRALTLAHLTTIFGHGYDYFEVSDFSRNPGQLLGAATYQAINYALTIGEQTTSAALWSRKYPRFDPKTVVFCEYQGIPLPEHPQLSQISGTLLSPYSHIGFDVYMPYKSLTNDKGENYMSKWQPAEPDYILLACYRTFISLNSIQKDFQSGAMELVPIIYTQKSGTITRILSPGMVLPKLTEEALEIIKLSLKASRIRQPDEFPLSAIPTNILPHCDHLTGKRNGIITGFRQDIVINW